MVDVTDAKEPAFSLPILAPATPYTAASAPVARPFCTPAFGPGSGSFGMVDVTDAKEPAFSLPILAPATPYTAASAPVARPFCTPAFGP